MNCSNEPVNQEGGSSELLQKLMVSGFVRPDDSCALYFEVRRGLPVFSEEGLEVGKVAAVILNGDSCIATHILLGRLPESIGYWLVPVELVAEVDDGKVQLSIPDGAVETLPRWHST